MTSHTPPLSNGVLDSRGHQIPLALVTEWGKGTLRVVCPYCLGSHRHTLIGLRLTGQTRPADCGQKAIRHYQLCYPFEEQARAQYSFRIDKKNGVFVTVGVALPDDNEEDDSEDEEYEEVDTLDDGEQLEAEEDNSDIRALQPEDGDQMEALRSQVDQLSIGDTETHKVLSYAEFMAEEMQDADSRQTVFDSYCINNDVEGVASLLERYKDDQFVSRRSKDGSYCVALAAAEGHDEMIEFLHSKGGDLNKAGQRGRTPLMEAALWGRRHTVDLLIEKGANQDVQDKKGRRAYFYAIPSARTARMRKVASPHYQEPREAETNRRLIAIKLQAFEPVPAAPRLPSEPQHGHFETITTAGRGIEIVFYDVPDIYKAIARLDRGRMFPVVSAASGWRNDFAVKHILNNRLWRDRVLELCRVIGYSLPEDSRDEKGLPGSHAASHAEKKLVAYYISEHVVLPSECFEGLANDEIGGWLWRDLELGDLAALCSKVPQVPASIKVNRAVCDHCREFISHVEAILGVSFEVQHC